MAVFLLHAIKPKVICPLIPIKKLSSLFSTGCSFSSFSHIILLYL